MRWVLQPQAVLPMLPIIIFQLAVVFKEGAIGFIILYPELPYTARFLGSQTQFGSSIIPVAVVIAVIYIGLCLILTGVARLVEHHLNR